MNRSDIPNIITIIRIGLVVPVVVALLYEQFTIALILFAVAGISDGLDGYLAKHYNWRSRLGSILDPFADKLLLVSTYIALAWIALLPTWLVTAVIARDLLIALGALAYHFLIGQYEMTPSMISKINTFAQIMLGIAIVFSMSVLPLPELALNVLVYFVFASTVLSGLDYIWIWGVKALRHNQNKQPRHK
ncbi:MAG: CDP-alcohol phosphatidyltransferase family protein [Gammaproteobacteria bacterium]